MKQRRPSKLSVAWTAGRLAGRRLLRRSVGDRDLALGDQLTAQLDEMKGLAMKLGQIVSYMDVPLPEAVQDRLAALQTGRRGMPASQVRSVIEASLGDTLEHLFDHFDPEPVAAASIGQVHRARLGTQALAVKVQYPDVAQSFADDVGAIDRIASLASLASAVDGKAVVRELAERLAEECDYQREGLMQHAFARAFADDPAVHVPAVLLPRCGPGVLTTAWVEGDDFAALRRDPSDARRNAVAQVLVRFTYRSLLQLAAIQADPHPGNFVFRRPGEGEPEDAGEPAGVTFLDFGCVRRLEPEMVEAMRSMTVAIRDDDRARFRDAAFALGVVGRPRKFDFDHYFAMMEHLHRPLLVPHFRFDLGFVREGLAFNGPTSPNARTLAMPPAYIWIARLQWGLWSILAKLRAEGDFSGIVEELLAAPIQPLSVPPAAPAFAPASSMRAAEVPTPPESR